MKPDDVPFPVCWYGVGIENYRDCSATYQQFGYDTIPPLNEADLRGTFSWLYETPEIPKSTCGSDGEAELLEQLKDVQRQSESLGITLPPEFLSFIGDPNLLRRVGSMTGSYWRLPDFIARCPDAPGFLIMFRSEGQDCLLWYLYLGDDSADHCVVVSRDYFGINGEPPPEFPDEPHRVFFCAPSFEAFVYREWIEHGAAWNIFSANPLTPRQQEYVDFYRPPNDHSDRRRQCEVHNCPLQPGHELWYGPGLGVSPVEFDKRYRSARSSFPNASAFAWCSWIIDSQEILAPRAYCPICRAEVVRFCEANDFGAILKLLRDRIEMPKAGNE